MSAIGTFDDGSTKTLTSGVFWSSDNMAVAPITSGGRITGASSGTATVTASESAQSGTSTVTVTLNNVTGITIMPTSLTLPRGQSGQLTVLASAGGTQVDVTATVTWSITDSTGAQANNISITTQTTPATVLVLSNAMVGQYTVTATYNGNTVFTKSITLTVT
jgi:hypothetical protein